MRGKSKVFATIVLALAVFGTARAYAIDWAGSQSAGGYVEFLRFGFRDRPVHTTANGVTYSYGLNNDWKVGGDFGVFLTHNGESGNNGATIFGAAVSPSITYDLVDKQQGSLYFVSRPLRFNYLEGGAINDEGLWALSFLSAGLGMEAKFAQDFGISLEGEAFRLGIADYGRDTALDLGVLLFPSLRLAMKMYF